MPTDTQTHTQTQNTHTHTHKCTHANVYRHLVLEYKLYPVGRRVGCGRRVGLRVWEEGRVEGVGGGRVEGMGG